MATSPFDELESPAAAAPEAAASPFAELETGEVAAESAESPFAALEPEGPAPYVPTEAYPGEHEHLKSINAISGREVQEIAAKNGVDPEQLRRIAPYWRVGVEEEAGQGTPLTDDMKKFAGYLGSAALDLPQYVYKLSQDPKMRGAIDDLTQLIETRKTGLQTAGEMVAGGLTAGINIGGTIAKAGLPAVGFAQGLAKAGKEVVKQSLIGTGMGAVSGLTHAREGEELESIEHGAVGGAVVGAGLGAFVGMFQIGGAISRSMGVSAAEAEEFANKAAAEIQKPEVAQAIQRGADRVARIAEGESPELAIQLEKAPIQKEIERLKVDEPHLKKLKEANPDIVAEAEAKGLDEEAALQLLAKREVQNRSASETLQFASYLKNQTIGPITTEKQLLKAIAPQKLRQAGEFIQKWAKSEGRTAEFLQQEWQNFKAVQIAQDLNSENLRRGFGITSNEFTRQVRKYFRVRGQFKIIDNRNGGLTNLEGTGDRMVEADYLKSKHLNQVIKEARPTMDAVTKSGLREDLSAQAMRELEETGTTQFKSEEQKTSVKAMSDLFRNSLEMARKLGVDIAEIAQEKAKVYLPKMSVDEATVTGRIRARIQEIEQKSKKSFSTHFTDADMEIMKEKAPKAFDELIQGLEYLSSRKIKRAETLSKYATQATTVDGTARLMSSRVARKGAGATMARQERGIPDFLRETDINKLYVRWNANVLKQAYWKDSLQELTKQRNLLAAKGDRAGVEYVDWYMKKLGGGEQGLARWASQTKARFVASLSEKAATSIAAGNPKRAKLYRALADNADITNLISASMYGNLLGFNPKSVVQNLVQPFVTLVPELSLGGNGWAAGKVVKGYFSVLKSLRNPEEARALVEPFMSPALSDEVQGAFRTGVEHGAMGRFVRGALDRYNTAALYMMQTSETLNRLVTVKMAEDIAQDLLRGSGAAEKFLNGVGAGYRRELTQLAKAGNAQELTRRMQSYLVGKTMFHYSPLMTSQLGSYMGKLGTAFSTWPTTITADLVADFAGKNAATGSYLVFKKYMAPLAALAVLDNWMEANGHGPDQDPVTRAYLGRAGFKGAAPIRSATDLAQRGIISSPYAEHAFRAFADAVAGDPEGWWKSTKAMGQTIVPGASFRNLLEVTIPRMADVPAWWPKKEED